MTKNLTEYSLILNKISLSLPEKCLVNKQTRLWSRVDREKVGDKRGVAKDKTKVTLSTPPWETN